MPLETSNPGPQEQTQPQTPPRIPKPRNPSDMGQIPYGGEPTSRHFDKTRLVEVADQLQTPGSPADLDAPFVPIEKPGAGDHEKQHKFGMKLKLITAGIATAAVALGGAVGINAARGDDRTPELAKPPSTSAPANPEPTPVTAQEKPVNPEVKAAIDKKLAAMEAMTVEAFEKLPIEDRLLYFSDKVPDFYQVSDRKYKLSESRYDLVSPPTPTDKGQSVINYYDRIVEASYGKTGSTEAEKQVGQKLVSAAFDLTGTLAAKQDIGLVYDVFKEDIALRDAPAPSLGNFFEALSESGTETIVNGEPVTTIMIRYKTQGRIMDGKFVFKEFTNAQGQKVGTWAAYSMFFV